MMDIHKLITDNIDVWTNAVQFGSNTGRGKNKKLTLHGVKKLRDLILELAVHGKLVPQLPSEEPASMLLEKMAKEKSKLIKEKRIKKPKKLPELTNEDLPYTVPKSWSWCRLQDISSYIQRGKGPKYDDLGKVKVISQKCIQWSGFDIEPARFVNDESLEKYQDERYLQPNDLLWNSTGTGTVGRINVLDEVKEKTLVADSHVTVIRSLLLNPHFIWVYISSPSIQARIEPEHENALVSGSTKQVELNTSSVIALEIPLPPEEEQNRIVEKVKELMALCEQLEQQTEASIDAHQLLVEELLSTLSNSKNTQEFEQSWTCIAEHFDLLFTTEHSIEQLKQTILQLAVMGKLVPQDPNDEHVDILLERISAHRDERVKAKEIQKPKKLSVESTPSFQIPKSWKNVLLNDLVFVTKLAGFEYTKYINLEDSGEIPVIRAQNVRPFLPDLTNLKYIDEETSLGLPRSALDKKCLLVTFIGAGIGDVCVLENDVRRHLAPNVAKVEAFSNFDLDYLCLYLNSPNGRSELFKSIKSTAQPSLSMTTIREIWVSIPPIEEQKRIVLKTRSLLELCEKLKFSISSASMTKVNLAKEIVEKALG